MPNPKPVPNRSEILFIYHVKDANPNGDPLDENKPRTDPDTGVATVTDVRIKRTIRDYWHQNLNLEILIRDTHSDKGYLNSGKQRAESFVVPEKKFTSIPDAEESIGKLVTEKCIDARCFGATLPIDKNLTKPKAKGDGSVTLTGPVQFSGFNRSLHSVAPVFIRGTAGFASKENEKTSKSFREEYLLPYACIACYGVINEIAAKTTNMSEQDAMLVLEGLWRGTENLISRSKMGHQPLLLIHLEYADNYRIGDLASRIKLESNGKSDTELRGTTDFKIDFSALESAIAKAESKNKVLNKGFLKDDAVEIDGIDLSKFKELNFER